MLLLATFFARTRYLLPVMGLALAGPVLADAPAAPAPQVPSLAELYKGYRLFDQPLVPEIIRQRDVPMPAQGADWMHAADSWVAKTPGAKVAPAPAGPAPTGTLHVESFYLNQQLPGKTGTNKIYCALAVPNTGGPFPFMFVFHGGGGHASEALAVALAGKFPGTAVLAMDYNGQFRPSKDPVTQWGTVTPEIHLGQLNLDDDPRNFYLYYAVCAARTVLDWAQEQTWSDKQHFGALGISYGGWVALMLAGVDSRIDLVYNNVSAGGVKDTASWTSRPLRSPPPFDTKTWLALADPISYAPTTKAAVFFSVCSNDQYMWITAVERNKKALPGMTGWVERPNSNHNGGGPPVTGPENLWTDAVWKGGKPLPTITATPEAGPGTVSWQVSPDAQVSHFWLCWSPGSTKAVDDCARYWIRLEATAGPGNTFSATIPAAWQGYAALMYPLVEFSPGYSLSGDLETRSGFELDEHPGQWEDQSLWDAARGADAWRPFVGDPAANTEIDPGSDGMVVLKSGVPSGQFAAVTDSVGLVSASAKGTGGLRLVLDGGSEAGTVMVRLTQKTLSLDEHAVEASVPYKEGKSEYVIPWSAFSSSARERTFNPATSWWDGLAFRGTRKSADGLGVGPIHWADAAAVTTAELSGKP